MQRWHLLPIAPLLFAAGLHSAQASAQTPLRLESGVFVERLSRDINGQERRTLAAPGALGQGDRLVFVTRYRNNGPTPVSGFSFTSPVPASVRLDSVRPDMLVSVDGGAHWGRLETMTLRTPLGGTRRATADDITHVRWTISSTVAPGADGRIAYRGVVR